MALPLICPKRSQMPAAAPLREDESMGAIILMWVAYAGCVVPGAVLETASITRLIPPFTPPHTLAAQGCC